MINEISIKNYKKFTNLKITPPKGTVCISAPNGAGKSTICQAIILCLFGKQRNTTALKPDSELYTHLTLDTDYRVLRKGSVVTLNDEPSSIEKVQKLFKSFFVSDLAFKSLFVIEQGALLVSSAITHSKTRDLFGDLFGFQIVESIIEQLHGYKEHKTLYNKLLTARTDHSNTITQLKTSPHVSRDFASLYETRRLQQLLHTPNPETDYTKAQLEERSKKFTYDYGKVSGELNFLKLAIPLTTAGVTQCPVCDSEIQDVNLIHAKQEKVKNAQQQILTELNKIQTLLAKFPKDMIDHPMIRTALGEDVDLDTADVIQNKKQLENTERDLSAIDSNIIDVKMHLKDSDLFHIMRDFYTHAIDYYLQRFVTFASQYIHNYTKYDELTYEKNTFLVDGVPIMQRSWGERATVLTALHLALCQLFCDCHLQQYPFLVFDSAFDYVDDGNAASIIEMLINSPYEQVILTTHNPTVPQSLGIPVLNL